MESHEAVEEPARKRAREESAGCLSSSEVEKYHREGWLVPRVTLPSQYVERLRTCLDHIIKENPGVRPERLVSAHLEKHGTEGVKGSKDFLELALHPTLLAAVEQLIGHDICLWGCQIFCKPGGNGMEVPMHQDGHYWPIRPLATVTAWVALDRSDEANGCLRVVPQSHVARSQYDHYKSDDQNLVLNQAIKESELDKLQPAVDVELEPGQFSLHDVYTVHGSHANTSTRRRAGVALRYMPTACVFERHLFESGASSGYRVDFANRPLFLVQGIDKSNRNTYTPLPGRVAGLSQTRSAVLPSTWNSFQRWLHEDAAIPWETAIEGRRVAQWGVRYDYARQEVDLSPVVPIPAKLRELFPEAGPELTQCIINEYGAKDGIPWHADHPAFGPDILVYCFGDDRPVLFRKIGAESQQLSVNVGHLGCYRFSGEARYEWEHSVPVGVAYRVSVTFRSVQSS
eukprot:TRINITY_DN48831_c0_g1_i1.p1 TRINITY_DN48831_c0_g1~~TRINITY_DN48831_c0_g1_i1.p1  ORF type:complete len:457 (+),score=54.45 TRINITY_DN48831_c0_g1_i1:90-1460(+)